MYGENEKNWKGKIEKGELYLKIVSQTGKNFLKLKKKVGLFGTGFLKISTLDLDLHPKLYQSWKVNKYP